mmetsp:Transcript_1815/g.4589  ORF Transcript_1815/g.4589 Transcript_1815/m.4589 type:complete len:234 (+) Transcript_1815:215-916(+)
MSKEPSLGIPAQRHTTLAASGSATCPASGEGWALAAGGRATIRNFWLLFWAGACCWMPYKLHSPAQRPTRPGSSEATSPAARPGICRVTASAVCSVSSSAAWSAMYVAISSSDVGRCVRKVVDGKVRSNGLAIRSGAPPRVRVYCTSAASVQRAGTRKGARPRVARTFAARSPRAPVARGRRPEASTSSADTPAGNLRPTSATTASPSSPAMRSHRNSSRSCCFFWFFERTHV